MPFLSELNQTRVILAIPLAFWVFAGFLINSGAQAEFGIVWLSPTIATIVSAIGLIATWLIIAFIFDQY